MDTVAGLDDTSYQQRIAAKLNFAHTLIHKTGDYDAVINICEEVRPILGCNKIDPIFWAHAENSCLVMISTACINSGYEEKGRK